MVCAFKILKNFIIVLCVFLSVQADLFALGIKSCLPKKEFVYENKTEFSLELLMIVFSFLEKQDFENIVQCCKVWKSTFENTVLRKINYEKAVVFYENELVPFIKIPIKEEEKTIDFNENYIILKIKADEEKKKVIETLNSVIAECEIYIKKKVVCDIKNINSALVKAFCAIELLAKFYKQYRAVDIKEEDVCVFANVVTKFIVYIFLYDQFFYRYDLRDDGERVCLYYIFNKLKQSVSDLIQLAQLKKILIKDLFSKEIVYRFYNNIFFKVEDVPFVALGKIEKEKKIVCLNPEKLKYFDFDTVLYFLNFEKYRLSLIKRDEIKKVTLDSAIRLLYRKEEAKIRKIIDNIKTVKRDEINFCLYGKENKYTGYLGLFVDLQEELLKYKGYIDSFNEQDFLYNQLADIENIDMNKLYDLCVKIIKLDGFDELVNAKKKTEDCA